MSRLGLRDLGPLLISKDTLDHHSSDFLPRSPLCYGDFHRTFYVDCFIVWRPILDEPSELAPIDYRLLTNTGNNQINSYLLNYSLFLKHKLYYTSYTAINFYKRCIKVFVTFLFLFLLLVGCGSKKSALLNNKSLKNSISFLSSFIRVGVKEYSIK